MIEQGIFKRTELLVGKTVMDAIENASVIVFSVLWVVAVTDCEVAFDCSVLSVFSELFPHPAKEMRKTISKEKLIILFIRLPYFESREIIEFI